VNWQAVLSRYIEYRCRLPRDFYKGIINVFSDGPALEFHGRVDVEGTVQGERIEGREAGGLLRGIRLHHASGVGAPETLENMEGVD
jgi:hypothetical protein